MFEINGFEISNWQWFVLFLAAFMIGVTKTGIPGIGILAVPLMAIAFPAKMSTGLLLPMLVCADIFAVAYYRRFALWSHILKLLPPAVCGIIAGSLVIGHINNAQLKPIIGLIVLAMVILNYWRQKKSDDEMNIPTHWSFAVMMGFLAGITTQLANAAGPIIIIYLIAMRLDKYKFMGTAAWYFMILNWLKVPLFFIDGRITWQSLKVDLITFPMVVIGAVAGAFILKNIPQKWFNKVVIFLTVAAAIKLVLSAFGI